MKLTSTFSMMILFVLSQLHFAVFAQSDSEAMKDRIEIQEKLLYAYAYAFDSKDCLGLSKLFTANAVLEIGNVKRNGRDAIQQGCIERQKNVVGNIKTHHNMTNIVFDKLTPSRAETRTYVVIT